MDRAQLPLNALRAFEAAARHLSFTRAAAELCVTQGAISHQVAALEARLGVPLFRRLPRGLALTDEGLALVPVLADGFDRMGAMLDRFAGGGLRSVLTVGVVGTFLNQWLLPRLDGFRATHPLIDLRLMANNNRVDLAGEGLDCAIRFGDGAWHGTHAEPVLSAPLSPLCAPELAARLTEPADLHAAPLLRSYRADEWPRWFAAAGTPCPRLTGPVMDSGALIGAAAMAGHGVALLPPVLFAGEIADRRLVQPFAIPIDTGSYWLTRLHSRRETSALTAFRIWLHTVD
ncbi:LysR family transcriptional regulator [Sphingomonas sp. CJ99]